ncbi:MAG: ATP-dependent DNA helicase [Candidatus Micrarchaeia archaeon]
MLYFRHEKMRKHQDRMLADVMWALENGRRLLCHAPTGMGKTDAVLSATLSFALEREHVVFFLTPKISQHAIAMDVLRGIRERYGVGFCAADILGRKHMCAYPKLSDMEHDDFLYACRMKRKNETCVFYKNSHRFPEFPKGYEVAHSRELCLWCEARGLCPYEIAVRIAARSKVIVADYFQIFMPYVREVFIPKIKRRVEESIIVVDEAHNLAARVQQQLSRAFSRRMAESAEKEARLVGSELIKEFARMKARLSRLCIKVGEREMLMEREEVVALFENYEEMREECRRVGEEYIEKTGNKSACVRLANFIDACASEEESIYIIDKNRIIRKCLDVSSATKILNECHAAILMSGTLVPMEMHRDVLGIENAEMREYPSPFPSANRLNMVATDVTTRFSRRGESEYRKIARKIERIVENVPGNIALFFPSYVVLEGVVKFLPFKVLVQPKNAKPREIAALITKFANSEKAVLACVQGGSLAEGVDIPNGKMKCAVIVGVALEEMGIEIEAMIDYYDKKFGRGWEYAYIFPAIVKAMQAAGRCIRSEKDRAAVVFLDERFVWKNYSRCFPQDFEFRETDTPEKELASFFSNECAKI